MEEETYPLRYVSDLLTEMERLRTELEQERDVNLRAVHGDAYAEYLENNVKKARIQALVANEDLLRERLRAETAEDELERATQRADLSRAAEYRERSYALAAEDRIRFGLAACEEWDDCDPDIHQAVEAIRSALKEGLE